ncbi:hypothetical protein M409DRAFT_63884 [Zasmidium cellare ATCC 36951]|uniref:AAA+ ATPase domain-containing protein n=1 Tax=Zasmidium cellare ATCC 36951 TaxID=1080233 RepID=A0A6A6CUW3_ZASCE|nr:uncharacterized protein M409DRAFT_63884 [Zasmidium cellare ATCC 36951]KAF2170835.1 hypothetical protein M409DRAFT_63884 [Zasmidium cellare ATCC 36951]
MADSRAGASNVSQRSNRLARLLHAFLAGLKPVQSSRDVQQFLQAICDIEDHATCVEKIGCSKSGLEILRKGLRFDISARFINGALAELLAYLAVPEVKRLANGEFLKRILSHVVSPPALWDAMVKAQQEQQLTPKAELYFAWLLLELLSWSGDRPIEVDGTAAEITSKKTFLESDDRELRGIGYRIERILQTKASGSTSHPSGPGGRHDNDFADYRSIAVYPTEDELTSKDRPYYNTAHALTQTPLASRVGHHLDNQFRLLREDFLAELREDIDASSGKTKSSFRRQRTRLQVLDLAGVHCGGERSRQPCALKIAVNKGLSQITNALNRRQFLRDNPNVLRHHSFGYLVDQGKIIAFGKVVRDEDLLCQDPPVAVIRTPGSGAMQKVVLALAMSRSVEFVLIDTAVFAYEPVLRCLQAQMELPLAEQLLAPEQPDIELDNQLDSESLDEVIRQVESAPARDLKALLGLSKTVKLDESQTASLLAGLRQSISLIQGPPGTGKSFIGALLAKALYDHTSESILVICFTNHALDQFLDDLLTIGIPSNDIVRLGSKSSAKTQHITLRSQAPGKHRSQENWDAINRLNEEVNQHASALQDKAEAFIDIRPSQSQILEYLEFSDDDYEFFEAFELAEQQNGYQMVGKGNKAVDRLYLIDRWMKYQDPGVFKKRLSPWHVDIWAMDHASRANKLKKWQLDILTEATDGIIATAVAFDSAQHTLHEALGQKDAELIHSKRIVACTTTAAAMYTEQLQTASPGIVLVEEAGEILESHVLTALTPSTKQLILIGDHQQLRPKVNNYKLTVEKGDGFDLNRSLFERLVLSGFPHTTLKQQHRMCPEISSLVRHLTYPELQDAPSTTARDSLRGLEKRVVFIKHEKQELLSDISDRRDQGSPKSKQNPYEAEVVKKVVKYMAQQGYGTSDQVVLTPYLGQLGLLRRELARDNDPVLNDLDSFELIKAGLVSPATASQTKRPLRLSTIDNYQGEESDIVVISLTRSNPDGDIGFMISPERLNVLLSRARKALIIIGNPATFMASRKGEELWKSFFDLLAKSNSILHGLPVHCQQHPDRQMILESPADFDKFCPDGGCSAPCGTLLSCGLHECPRKCHRLADHTKMKCDHIMRETCPQGHVLTRKCSEGHPASCHICDAEAAAKQAKQERDLELEQKRPARQAAYAAQLAAIDDQLTRIREDSKAKTEEEQQAQLLQQRQKDLETAKARKAQKEAADHGASDSEGGPGSPVTANTADDGKTAGSESHRDWEYQKTVEGAINPALDDLIRMIGLEGVKQQFLEIKSKVDLLIRQDLSAQLERERFGAALLGNPGTGKTTVARLYAKFLCSVGALPGDDFVESTGSKLANEGVQGSKKLLDDLLEKGGGVFFIDEAYQLASGSSIGGAGVLDFLLAEVENLTGKIVFVLAGYNKQMEKFFQHNPGLPSRFPRTMQFADYEDDELLAIMQYNIKKRYQGRMKLEDGTDGLFARIVARRIGRGRGKEGFGNAREVENVVSIIASRQAKRLRKERRVTKKDDPMPDDMLLTQEDLIGPEPSSALTNNKAWVKLQKLIGLQSVKDSVKALIDSLVYNYKQELAEKPLVEFSLNKVFLGNAGTGKTTVAKMYGQILADMGMLSSAEVVIKKPADFIGAVIGASEANTKGILDAAVGKVLVIDEAYGLYGGGSNTDPYRIAVIDTIVAEIQSVPGDDRCVLLLGYKHQMEEMMQNANPGLARRFPIDSGFQFEDFDNDDMAAMFDMKLKGSAFTITPRGRVAALEMLARARNRPHFGNAGEVDILLNDAQLRQQKRISRETNAPKGILEAVDIDPEFDRGERALTNITMLFKETIGCETIINQLQEYQNIVANMKKLDQDPREQIPFSFLFRGPPGTGKTTTASKMGKVFYDMGFLASAEVMSCSASDLVGEYVGQTGPRTRKLLEKALGKVLFIDEAYRLAGGHFAQEAMDELVDCMTKEQFFQKLIIILAGYDADINRLMSSNPGLTSRFPETIVFEPLKPEDCLVLLTKTLGKKKGLDITVLSALGPTLRSDILPRFATLTGSANFANARDVQTLSKSIYSKIVKHPDAANQGMKVTSTLVLESIDKMIAERCKRQADATMAGALRDSSAAEMPMQHQHHTPAPTVQVSSSMATREDFQQEVTEEEPLPSDANGHGGPSGGPDAKPLVQRDAGVSDAIWYQLQLDRKKAEDAEKEHQRLLEEEHKLAQWLKDCADAQRQKELEELARKRKEIEKKRRQEAKEKQMLMQIGRCPVGYEWIKQANGYRCAGGSHWIGDGDVANMMGQGI